MCIIGAVNAFCCSVVLFYVKKLDLISFIILYAENYLPRSSYIVVLPEDGLDGRNMLQSTISTKKNVATVYFCTFCQRAGVIDGWVLFAFVKFGLF